MIKLRQHIPAFIDGVERETWEFPDVAAMLAFPRIKSWMIMKEGFHRFSVSRREGLGALLMVEYDNGASWFVLGYILEGDVSELPDWRGTRLQ